MPRIENTKEHFYTILKEHIKNGKVSEIGDISSLDSGFYELCKCYADVGLNAPKRKTENGLNIEALFQYNDLDKADEETHRYIDEHSIADVDAFIDAIRSMHSYAVEGDDKRPQSTIQWKDNNWNQPQLGSYIVFSQLPEDVFDDIAEAVKTGVKKWYA